MQNDDEEITLRQSTPRSNQNWVVYPKKTTAPTSPISRNPDHKQRYIGLMLMKQKRYSEAVDILRELAQSPDSEGAYDLLGLALLHNSDVAEARATFQRVVVSGLNRTYVDQSKKKIDQIDYPTDVK